MKAPEYDDEKVALSPSTGETLIEESPLHAHTFHRLLGGKRRKGTGATDLGTLFHALLLEDGKGVEVIDADAFRSNDAKAARDLAISKGLVPVVKPKYEAALPVVERIRENMAKAGFPQASGASEVKVEWKEAAEPRDVVCHARIDWLSDDWTRIVDLKTTEGSVHPDACTASLFRYGGAMQDAAYRSAVTTLHPELAGRVSFTFWFVELREPYAVTPMEAAGCMREFGESRWQRAIALWSRCLENDEWPGYATSGRPNPAYVPAWAMAKETMEDAA